MQTLRINVVGLLKEPAGGVRDHVIQVPGATVASMAEEARPLRDLTGSVRLLRSPRSIFVRVRLDTDVALDCSRCLEDAVSPVKLEFDAEFFPSVDVVTGLAVVIPDDDLAFVIDHNHELDLAEAVRQELLLGLPMYPLCDPECEGLCPTCGANRNTDPCDCDDSEPDPRMASLKGLFGAGGETDRPS